MNVFAALLKFFLIDIHRFYFRLVYRITVRLSHQFGIRMMVINLFKPLFDFPGIIARINGVFIRSLSITLGSIILLAFVIASIFIYISLIFSPFLITEKPWISLSVIGLICLAKIYDYYQKRPININDIDALRRNLADSKKIKEFLDRAELDYERSIDLLHSTVITDPTVLQDSSNRNLVEEELLFTVFLMQNPGFEKFMAKESHDKSDLLDTVEFLETIRYRSPAIWENDYQLPPAGGVDNGWAVGYTGTLNKYSTDLTKEALKGRIPKLVGREKVKSEVITILTKSTRRNVLLLGKAGSGKTTFVNALAGEIALGKVIPILRNKRLVSLDIGSLTSGSAGEINDRITKIISEVENAENIILFIDEIHNLASTPVFSSLEPHLTSGSFQFIGTTSRKNYAKNIQPNDSFTKTFDIVELLETTEAETKDILAEFAKDIENKSRNMLVTHGAVKSALHLSQKYIHYRAMPDKAVELLNQAYSRSRNNKDNIIDSADVAKVISEIQNIPAEKVEVDEKELLLHIEDVLHERIVGQNAAVHAISKALKRARVGIRNEKRPIAGFLFVGPTGVGKTETAKTLAESYFGSEDDMIRIDMSEYQTPDSINRLIGSHDGAPGQLLVKVQARPFSLILLDEIEKANQHVLNLFLQVLDDGRLTSADGDTTDFTNTLIIMTSNVGTKEITAAVEIDQVAMEQLKEYFAPEFLNRFTGIIPFKPLSVQDVLEIVKIKLRRLQSRMAERQVELKFTEEVVREISQAGYSVEWGAREINRVIEDKVESKIADKILSGEISPGDTFTLEKI